MKNADPLYVIFEQHLLNALVEEETTEEFLNRVVQDYIARLGETVTILQEHRPMIEEDLREEVLEMLRKKTYGHYSLKEYRKARAIGASSHSNAPAKEVVRQAAAGGTAAGRPRARRSRRPN